jgi:4,5-dihydroxyphthalate decarboxylase
MSKKLRLSLGCWNYDRTRALQDGRVQPDGIDLTYLDMPVEETFFRMLRHQEFDVAELSLSSYTVSLFKEKKNFIAIPVFPSRFFRHSCIYVNANADIREPKDLIGKKVGNPEYQMTAPVWIRGILQDEYGVPVDSVTYHTGGEEEPNRSEKLKLDLPPNIRVKPIGAKDTLAAMLRDGSIDAFYTARMPSTYHTGGGRVKRLFENYMEVEQAYYRKTRIFPIMHTVAIKRSVYEKNPWVAMSLYKAFVQAQRLPEGDASVAHEARGGCPRAHGRRFLAVRLRAQPQDAGDLPALPPRAGIVEDAPQARRALRPRNPRELPHLTWPSPSDRRNTRLPTT